MRTLPKLRNAVFLGLLFLVPPVSHAQVSIGISVRIGPPVLPVYVQPDCPSDDYLWTPGYWAYGPVGYYWVPGVWVRPPHAGLLWTPGYWGFESGLYAWHPGYWGPHVGFYGGIDYGYGYGGEGFVGGRWSGDHFLYNTAVVRVNTRVVHNVYVDRTVIRNTGANRASFNGQGGINRQPNGQERNFDREQHVQPTSNQLSNEHAASQDRHQFASENHGRPATAAMDSVNGHRYNQQGRVASGAASGQPAPAAMKNPGRPESNVSREVHTDRATNGGASTPQGRQQVNRQQSNTSRPVDNNKQNAVTPPRGNPEGNARSNSQQQHASPPSENTKTERNNQHVNGQVKPEGPANGGKPTGQQKPNANREQNNDNRQGRDEKHNDKNAPR